MKRMLMNFFADENFLDLMDYAALMLIASAGSFLAGRYWAYAHYLTHVR